MRFPRRTVVRWVSAVVNKLHVIEKALGVIGFLPKFI